MATEYLDSDAFRGASFRHADFTGATFHDCDLTGVRILASEIAEVRVSGTHGSIGQLIVDDVDVTAYVAAELDRRHPERVQLRALRTAEDYRAMWETIEGLWSETLARADALPEAAQNVRVDGDWSFVETLRHLVFADDVWVGRLLLDEPGYHRMGLPPTDYPDSRVPEMGIDLEAAPSYAEVAALHDDRRVRMRGRVATVTDSELERIRTAVLAPAWGEESHSVGACLRVVMREHCEHLRYAMRDLAVLEAR